MRVCACNAVCARVSSSVFAHTTTVQLIEKKVYVLRACNGVMIRGGMLVDDISLTPEWPPLWRDSDIACCAEKVKRNVEVVSSGEN